jgi:hypothetical protein
MEFKFFLLRGVILFSGVLRTKEVIFTTVEVRAQVFVLFIKALYHGRSFELR